MYYWRIIFNNNGLFQRFGGWLRVSEKDSFINSRIEELLSRSMCAYINLNRMENINKFCIEQFNVLEKHLTVKDNEIEFWSPSLAEMFNEFSAYLSNFRIMQNLIWCLSVRGCNPRANPPKSINDGVKKIDVYGIDETLKKMILEYMTREGDYIRNCRDLDQHYVPIMEHSFMQINPTKKVKVLLPDNPEVQSRKKLKFDRRIDAMDFFKQSFIEFHDFSESIAEYLGFKAKDIPHTFKFHHRGSDARTLALYIDNPYRCDGLDIYQNNHLKIEPRQLPLLHGLIKPESMVFEPIKFK